MIFETSGTSRLMTQHHIPGDLDHQVLIQYLIQRIPYVTNLTFM